MAIYSENNRELLTRENIVNFALDGFANLFKETFTEAQDILRNVFGMEMVETSTRITMKTGIGKTNKKYILRLGNG